MFTADYRLELMLEEEEEEMPMSPVVAVRRVSERLPVLLLAHCAPSTLVPVGALLVRAAFDVNQQFCRVGQ
jgi:hypothetical protein